MSIESHVNASGFPLQIGIGNHVNSSTSEHGWKVRYQEHAWEHKDAGQSGFMDLVLEDQYGVSVLNIECKRVKETEWIFLIKDTGQMERRHAKAFIYEQESEGVIAFDWQDLTLDPTSPQSQFCVIPGSDKRSKSLIERTAAELVYSTEALAMEDKFIFAKSIHERRIYFNVIVTTATLQVCAFDASKVSLSDGSISESSSKEVPYVRFRKQLLTSHDLSKAFDRHGRMNAAQAKENTVFIVNASHLSDFLVEFEINDVSSRRVFGHY